MFPSETLENIRLRYCPEVSADDFREIWLLLATQVRRPPDEIDPEAPIDGLFGDGCFARFRVRYFWDLFEIETYGVPEKELTRAVDAVAYWASHRCP